MVVQECEHAYNERKFRLNDLLSLPYQRILKYPLLLTQLIKLTPVESPQHAAYEEAKTTMEVRTTITIA